MKKNIKRLRNILWSLLLSAAIVIESTAGASVVYATEITDHQTMPDVSEITEESGESQENPTEGEDENNENDSVIEDGELGGGGEKDPGESDNQQNESEENNDETDVSDELEGDNQGDSDENEPEEGDSEQSEEDENDSDEVEEETDESDEETDGEESDVEDDEDASLATELFGDIDPEQFALAKDKLAKWAEENGYVSNGHRNIDYDVDNLTEPIESSDDSFPKAYKGTAVPAKYDARTTGRISSIKDQGAWGTCWAFSAVNSAESAYKKINGTEADLSETHLVNFFYNGNTGVDLPGPDGGLSGDKTTALTNVPVQQGGNAFLTTFALANWKGVADEATNNSLRYPDAGYTNNNYNGTLSISTDYAYSDAMHLKNAYWIDISDKANVKKAIMEYATVGISYYSSVYYSSEGYKQAGDPSYSGPAVQYCPYEVDYYHVDGPVYTISDHAVAIVGWDDNFSKENFVYTFDNAYKILYLHEDPILPKRNGAWLIKNSWGPDVMDDGYFWISYEDISLIGETAFAFDFDRADNYDHNYQYDGSAGTSSLSSSNGTITASAVYTASGDQKISAVGVGFASASTNYTVRIYKDLTDVRNPESGTLATTVKGKTSFAGFYTIDINDLVFVDKNENFSIVIIAEKNGRVELFTDNTYQFDWISFTASTANDRTFLKVDSDWVNAGTDLVQVSSSLSNCTFRIKAYTHDVDLSVKQADKDITDKNYMLEEVAPQVFNGDAVKPEFNFVFDGTKLREGVDYRVIYENESNKKVGTATAIIEGVGEYTGQIKTTFAITKKAVTADMITDIEGWTYDGSNHEIALTVENDENLKKAGDPVLMEKDRDYTVKYSKSPLNTAGTYTVTVTGKAPNYSGSAKKTFTVDKLDLDSADITLEYETVEYTGTEKKPSVTVMYGETPIDASNYTVKYTSNKAAGDATVTITGKSNCLGIVTKTFAITPKSFAVDDVTVNNGIYTGSEVKPAVTVKDGRTTLKLNQDYVLSYSDNIDATDKAKVTVTGINNYNGTIVEKTFEIARQTVAANKIKVEAVKTSDGSSCTVTVSGKPVTTGKDCDFMIYISGSTTDSVAENSLQLGVTYDIYVSLKGNYQNANGDPAKISNVACKKSIGSYTVEFINPKNPADTSTTSVTYNGKAQKPAIQVKDEVGEILKTKYYSVSYADNVNAGTATITVAGKGDYSGTNTVSFAIDKKKAALTVSIPDQTYTGKESTPTVTIKDGKTKLKAGTDYIVEYSDNTNATDENRKAKAAITLLNYEKITDEEGPVQTQFTEEFVINPAKISSVKISGSCYYKNGDVVEPAVIVKAGKLADLTNNEDYVATYDNQRELSTSKSKASVTVVGKGNFQGTTTVKYSITKESLAKAKWGVDNKLVDRVYEGKNIEPDITLYNSAGGVIPTDAYEVTYKNNKNVGTASVTIKPTDTSIYSGSATKKFKITKAELSNMIETSALNAKTYTGSKQTYTTAEIQSVVRAKVEGDQPTYKISYSNNVNAGTATVILTGSGNYTGKVNLNFTVKPRDVNDDNVKITLQSTSVSLGTSSSALAKIKQAVYGKLKLKANKDYTLSYVNSNKTGVAAVKVTGAGNYTGTRQIIYVVVR